MKQAVVVIHGIGEQKPSETGGPFTRSMLPHMKTGEAHIYSQPDQSPEFPDLLTHRRWSWSPDDVNSYEPDAFGQPWTEGIHIDFYEYYWAYLISDNKYGQLRSWLQFLLLRRSKDIPPRLKGIWVICWMLFLLGILCMIYAAFKVGNNEKLSAQLSFLLGIVSFVLAPCLSYFILGYLGDAARYLHDPKGNYRLQGEIKSRGKAILKRLHEEGDYERIILVGHSLGSVIGYDIINELWKEYKREWQRKADKQNIQIFDEEALRDVETIGTSLNLSSSSKEVEEFQSKQYLLWSKQRKNKNAWLVSDFITMGSPLTHYSYLMCESENALREKQEKKELATCPPTVSKKQGDQPFSYQSGIAWLLHHAAPFACTRWTNIYFEDDIVGGALKTVFGLGILDKCISSHNSLSFSKRWLTHTWYWLGTKQKVKQSLAEESLKADAVKTLRKALKLNVKPDSFFD